MKILCIGRNYVDHVKELNNQMPDEPVIFLKPDTALLLRNEPFILPVFSDDIHHELELIVRIGKEGKYIDPEFAHRYIDGVGLGIDFTARDIQSRLKEKGLPWEKAKAFNGSAPVSDFLPVSDFPDLHDIAIRLDVNGSTRQEANTGLMIHRIPEIISHVSKYFSLRKGDILFTGTPAGVSRVAAGDCLEGYLNGIKLLDFKVR